MKKATLLLLSIAVALGVTASLASAALRVPQVVFNSASLQGYLNGVGEAINVNTDQQAVQTLQRTASGNSTFSFMLELAGNAPANNIGVYNGSAASPTLFQIFPGAATQGWFAVATFKPSGQLIVNLFDQNANIQGSSVYTGVDGTNFGFYLQGPGGTFYTQDARNAGGKPQMLFFAGTGINLGQYWLAFEDLPFTSGDVDFNDAVLFLESVTPTATNARSWGSIKRSFR